ncbi:MAG: FAD-dependent oxidoreductase, partial [Oscillospiraceae bacterium]
TAQIIECDTLILSVGLIPENELAETMSIALDGKTKGPVCDQSYETSLDGVFVCGNALHVNDLVDYVSESGEAAGTAAANYSGAKRTLADIDACSDFAYAVPEKLNTSADASKTVIFFRSREVRDKTTVRVLINGEEAFKKNYAKLKPPEMERIVVDFSSVKPGDKILLEMGEMKK